MRKLLLLLILFSIYNPIFCQEKFQNDTSNYSMIYVSFRGEESPTKIPLYFNGRLIWTLKRYTRMSYKIYSEGLLKIERNYNDKTGPVLILNVQHNKTYGIFIDIANQYAIDPNKKFSFNLATEAGTLFAFFQDNYYGFKDFLSEEKQFIEDKNDPIIKK